MSHGFIVSTQRGFGARYNRNIARNRLEADGQLSFAGQGRKQNSRYYARDRQVYRPTNMSRHKRDKKMGVAKGKW